MMLTLITFLVEQGARQDEKLYQLSKENDDLREKVFTLELEHQEKIDRAMETMEKFSKLFCQVSKLQEEVAMLKLQNNGNNN